MKILYYILWDPFYLERNEAVSERKAVFSAETYARRLVRMRFRSLLSWQKNNNSSELHEVVAILQEQSRELI